MGPYDSAYNPYAELKQERMQANELTSEREKIRNLFIDNMGRKPSEDEIDEILVMSSGQGGSSQQAPSTLLRPPPPLG